ncbi:hypothetical protein [Simkania sp.]|uniref:hypothetical protein n=1 Tax=Simkania sp. TaxID=34094 RepID=UPI003B5202E1
MSAEATQTGTGATSQTASYQYGGCTYYGAPPPEMHYQPVYTVSNEEWQRIYNAELGVLADGDNLEGAEQVLQLFNEYGFKPSSVCYTKLIHAYGRKGKLDAAYDIFQSMQKGGTEPNVFHYHALMHQCVKNGDESRVFDLYREMKKKHVKPNRFIYDVLISANVNKDNLGDAGRILESISESLQLSNRAESSISIVII